jgi:hypothetical protein
MNGIIRRFFYNDPRRKMGLQIFVKMDLKCRIYGPEHKQERFRSIEVIDLNLSVLCSGP